MTTLSFGRLGRMAGMACALAGLLCGLAQAQTSRYTYAADGSEVTDSRTGLIWQRCGVGQRWTGVTCEGSAELYTHEQALTLAQAQVNWRLPNVKELASIVDRRLNNPAIDPAVFPNTPPEWYWSSTPLVGNPSIAWVVFFGSGVVDFSGRTLSGHVRLVR
jgi:hypothetical protein